MTVTVKTTQRRLHQYSSKCVSEGSSKDPVLVALMCCVHHEVCVLVMQAVMLQLNSAGRFWAFWGVMCKCTSVQKCC